MEITLRNIGMVQDASITLDGLTVVTGKNETGKTTMSRVLYAILNAVSNLRERADDDRNNYILERLRRLSYNSKLFEVLEEAYAGLNEQYPFLCALALHEGFPRVTAKAFALNVEEELTALQRFYERELDEILSDPVGELFLQAFSGVPYRKRRLMSAEKELATEEKALKTIRAQIADDLRFLQGIFRDIDMDPELAHYTRLSLNRSLNEEFFEQIQPVNRAVKSSGIRLRDGDDLSLEVRIQDNQVVEHTFHDAQIKQVYFIDNPSVLEQITGPSLFSRGYEAIRGSERKETFFNPDRIREHAAQLRSVLGQRQKPSVLKETILDKKLSVIKGKVNDVVPGTFAFTRGKLYYQCQSRVEVKNGCKTTQNSGECNHVEITTHHAILRRM